MPAEGYEYEVHALRNCRFKKLVLFFTINNLSKVENCNIFVGTLYFAYQPGPPYSTLYLIYTQLADTSTHTLTHFPSECDFIITIVVASSFAVYF